MDLFILEVYMFESSRTDNLFAEYKRYFVLGVIISKNTFKFLLSPITFTNFTDQQKNWSADQFAAMRSFFELFNINLTKYIAPSKFLTIDGTLNRMTYQM